MKKIFKATLAVIAIATVGMGTNKAFQSYSNHDVADEGLVDLLLTENVLALSDGPGSYRYPTLQGKPKRCTIDIYISIKTGHSYLSIEALRKAEGNVAYYHQQLYGIYDNCPDNGAGCNPYDCKIISYKTNP